MQRSPQGHRGQAGAARYSPRPLTEGELWVAAALSRLRERRYRPAAWSAFVGESYRRSMESRRQRPALVRQARRWGVVGALSWLGACRIAAERSTVRPRQLPGLLWWLCVWQMLDWHLGMAEGGDGRPRERLSKADAVTLARFWLVPAVGPAGRSARGLPAVIAIGGLSDWADGALARRSGRTRLGRDLDSTADLAFLTAAALAARREQRISALGFAAITARHAAGLGLSFGAVFGRARRPAIRARPWGAVARICGLALGSAGARRTGTALLVAGSLVPPRSTAPGLSRA